MASLSPTSPPHLSGSLEASSAGSNKSHRAVKAEPSPPDAPPAAPKRAPLPSQPKSAAAPQAPFVRISLPPVNKMSMTAVISPSPQTEQPQPKMSMTSKEWVIPPRPKPGRKPATDTPPTKRKAQNRAAQRAFRERRAARVGELEEMLDEHKKAQDSREKELTDQIRNLELDVQSFRSRCLLLESMLERERQERIRAEMQAETLSRRYEQANNFRSESLGSLPPPYGRQHQQQHHPQQRHSLSDSRMAQQQTTTRHFSISQIVTPPEISDIQSPHDPSETHLTCGSCSPNGRCACAEEVLASVVTGCGKCGFGTACQCLDDSVKATSQGPELKRPLSPSVGASQEKRQRPTAAASTETDFTSLFSRTSQQQLLPQPSSIISQLPSADTLPFRDSCGFCKDGTYCVCADAAMATPAMTPGDASPPVTRQTRTPPPLESDVVTPLPPMAMEMTADGAVKLPRRKPARAQPQPQTDSTAARGSCGPNGPGTCAQCQADPKSGLFCRLMVASFNREQGGASAGGGCCGGKGPGGGCCKSKPSQEKITLPSLPSLGLSCADAYQTLSSHSKFEQAADEIGSWLPKLKAHPTSDPRAAQAGRIPIEVEAASIMSVLKEFDVRFGREC
ncbi:hypothetical protein CCMA1212_004155 [Trichoderma ghanense]|uniref:BZIP domain-containing protein n=1 Tax=Trichoderma ghanense TaxID=65468 RepID=A0ABY2H805_9HYPO